MDNQSDVAGCVDTLEILRTRLLYATTELSDYLRQLAGDIARDVRHVNITQLLQMHHAVCEGLTVLHRMSLENTIDSHDDWVPACGP